MPPDLFPNLNRPTAVTDCDHWT